MGHKYNIKIILIMKNLARVFAVAAVAFFATSCATVGTSVGAGGWYTKVKDGVSATSNPIGAKIGTASATNILGILATGDASIQTAANSAGIKRISHIDVEKTSVLGLFSKSTIYVYGE